MHSHLAGASNCLTVVRNPRSAASTAFIYIFSFKVLMMFPFSNWWKWSQFYFHSYLKRDFSLARNECAGCKHSECECVGREHPGYWPLGECTLPPLELPLSLALLPNRWPCNKTQLIHSLLFSGKDNRTEAEDREWKVYAEGDWDRPLLFLFCFWLTHICICSCTTMLQFVVGI